MRPDAPAEEQPPVSAAEVARLERQVRRLQARVAGLAAERDRAAQALRALLGSRKYRLIHALGRLREKLAPAGGRRARALWRLSDLLLRRPQAPRATGDAVGGAGGAVGAAARGACQQILDRHPDRRGVVVFPPVVDWGWMRQRPQHLATQFARQGYVVCYCPPQTRTDFVQHFTRIEERLYLCGDPGLLHECPRPILWLSKPQQHALARRFRQPVVVYDCLDDLAVHARDGRVSAADRRRHQELLRSAAVVCATSTKLYDEIRPSRPDALLCPNAVDFDHFNLSDEPPPDDLAPLVRAARPIVGYYGALAEWFDFDLLRAVAGLRPRYAFVLIGPDYDGTLARYAPALPANVHWLGEKHYEDLPAYLHHFAVATIPFRLNPVTLATSPLKLFEYLAAGKPVVTTPLPECQRQVEVLTATTAEEFAAALDAARAQGEDPALRERLRTVARENSWRRRVELIVQRLPQPASQGP